MASRLRARPPAGPAPGGAGDHGARHHGDRIERDPRGRVRLHPEAVHDGGVRTGRRTGPGAQSAARREREAQPQRPQRVRGDRRRQPRDQARDRAGRADGEHRRQCAATGESGTGKELVARPIHANSARRGRRSCPSTAGRFPNPARVGAVRRGARVVHRRRRHAPGRVRGGRRGTIFLDEISNMPLAMQVKLLRVCRNAPCDASAV